ncbi:hypothetical protein D9M69_390860 [compost metagenome]
MDIPVDLSSLFNWLWQNAAQTIYCVAILWLLGKLRKLAGALIKHGPTAFRRWRRRRLRTFLLTLREYDRDPLLLQFEINRSGVYLTLFWVCALLWLPLSFFILLYIPAAREWPNLAVASATPPMYFFEVLWVLKSSTLSDVFKRRKVVTTRRSRKATATSQERLRAA